VFFSLHQIVLRFHKLILVFTVLATVGAISLTFRLKLDSNLFSLLPSDNDSVKAFSETTEAIGFQSLLIALVEMPTTYDRETCDAFIDFLGEEFADSHLIDKVEYKSEVQRFTPLFRQFMPYFTFFLTHNGLESLAERLSDVGIQRQVFKNKKLLTTPLGLASEELLCTDPLGLRDSLQIFTSLPSGKYPLKAYEGFYRTQDGNTYFLFMKPKKPPQDVNFSKELMAEVHSLEKASLSEFSRRFGNISGEIHISYAGGYPIAVNDEAASKRDIKVTILGSFFAVMLLFGLTFKTTRMTFFVGVPVAISILWTLGFAQLAFHDLNVLTCVFSCVLIGLGVDFAIHIVNRFFDEDKTNLDLPTRLEQTFEEAGMGLVIGGTTTAAAFYSIAISDFKGFQELGILTGTGVLICLLTMLFVLPSLLVLFPNKKKLWKKPKIAGFGLKVLLGFLEKHAIFTVLVALGTFCLFVFAGTGINFDDNLKNFRPADQEVFQLQDKVTGWLGGSTAEILLVVEGRSETEVMETNAAVFEALDELRVSGRIAGVKSISQYLVPPSQQRSAREFIRQRPHIFDMERIKRTFLNALETHGFEKLDSYNSYFEGLAKAFEADELVVPSLFEGTKLEKYLKMFVFQKGQVFKAITYIVPSKDLWSRASTRQLKEEIIQQLDERGINRNGLILTGASLLTGDLKDLIINNLKSSLWMASLVIILILTIYYRRLKLITLAILPLVIGLGLTVGVMALLRIDFNFFNLIVLPMVVGIGIDDGVHLTNTFCRSRSDEMLLSMSRTARAVVLTSLTTVAGFGSISLSHYPGLRSMGYVAIIGVSACLLTSIAILPPILSIMKASSRDNRS